MLSNLESALQMRLPALHDAPRQSVRSDIVSWYQMALWKAEYEPQADAERGVRHRRRSAAVRRAAFGCPCLIVVDELRKIAARIEKRC